MFFKKRIKLYSILKEDELILRLNSITERQYTHSGKYKFEGKIGKKNFIILPTFNYGPRAQFRPEIKGEIETQSDASCLIHILFKLPSGFKILFLAALVFNSGILIYSHYNHIENPFIRWEIFLSLLILTVSICLVYFHIKVEKSTKILMDIFKARRLK